MQVDTRGGVFSPDGYGGGVFNQNVAFGAIDSNSRSALGPATLRHPLAGGTWGAIPWVCWGGASGLPENKEFKDCVAAIQRRMPGASQSDPGLLAAAQSECSGLCNQLAAEQQVYGGSYSADTANLQSRINSHIHASRAQDATFPYCPVAEDGKLGPETCTASQVLFGGQWPDMCDAIGFASPWKDKDCAGGHDVSPAPPIVAAPPPSAPPPSTMKLPKKAGVSTASMMVGGVIALGALGALAWYGSDQGWFK